MRRRFAIAFAAALLAVSGAAAKPLVLTTHRIDAFGPALSPQAKGPLTFLGGLEASSDDADFGGLSGVDFLGPDAALFISDAGRFVRARLVHDNGRLAGLADAEIGDLFPQGDVAKFDGDVEDVALDPADPGRGAIVMERQRQALRSFRLKDGEPQDFASVPLSIDRRILRSNKGLESLAFGPPSSPLAGQIVVVAERPYRSRGASIPAWIVAPGTIGKGAFSIARRDGFDVSSARFLPGGDLLLLERLFSPAAGLAVRLRRIPGATIRAGAIVDGDILLDAGLLSQIDNMEGLAVSQDGAGRTVLTLVSDDNFSILQRTLILQFALAGG